MNKMDLRHYVIEMGKFALQINAYLDVQNEYVRSGVLDEDEMELAETIEWLSIKVFKSMDSQLGLIGERMPEEWSKSIKEIIKDCLKSED